MNDFRQKAIKGFTWSLVSQVGRQGMVFLVNIILVGLLSPSDFGLMAMITVIIGIATIFSEHGFGSALIQKKDITEMHLSSVFWLNLTFGLFLSLFFILTAPLIATFYSEPSLIPLTRIISLSFFIGSFNVVQNALLTKDLNFRSLSIVEVSAVTVAGIIAVILAINGFGIWSLITQSLLVAMIKVVLLWQFNPWRPKLLFSWAAIKEILGFSISLLGTQTLNYGVRNIDYVLIGRFLGSAPLGIYTRAYTIMLFPASSFSRVISRVMFPSFSIIHDDKKRISSIYFRITRLIALFAFPVSVGVFLTASTFVSVIFGEEWLEMIPILRILSFVGLIQSIMTLNGNLYLSQGKADLQFKLGIILRFNLILGIVIGLRWGLMGVAVGYAIAVIINVYPNFFFAGRLINITFLDLVKNLLPTFSNSLIMGLCVWLLGIVVPSSVAQGLLLTLQVVSGGIIYFGLGYFFNLAAINEMRQLFFEQWRMRGSSNLL